MNHGATSSRIPPNALLGPATRGAPPDDPTPLQVLVFDGEPSIRAVVCELLEYLGCSARSVASCAAARSLMDEARFDLALLDCDALRVTPAMFCASLTDHADAPLMVLSGQDRASLAGAPPCVDLLLPKPFGLRELEFLVGQARSAGAPPRPN